MNNNTERYIGSIIRADGTGHKIYRLPIQRGQNMTWGEAIDYAKEEGAELPDRVEGALMNWRTGNDATRSSTATGG